MTRIPNRVAAQDRRRLIDGVDQQLREPCVGVGNAGIRDADNRCAKDGLVVHR